MSTDKSQPKPPEATQAPAKAKRALPLVPILVIAGLALVILVGLLLHHHAASKINRVALSATPKDVSVVRARATTYQPTHRYVGTLRPWIEANVGPQLIAAYVSTVLVRPGAVVKRNQVLGTLDCRDASARSHSVDLEARALQDQQIALAAQAQRMTGLLDGGYIAANEVEQNAAQSNSEQARLESERAKLVDAQLSVGDCVLRAPFDGDVGVRWVDPGAFIRPGEPVVTVVDRSIVRLVMDVPEDDFAAVAPGSTVRIHLVALNEDMSALISRRSPEADPATRTIHVEIDLPDPAHHIPVNTTAEVTAGSGRAVPATAIPVVAADLNGEKAKLFTVADGTAHEATLPVLGEAGGALFLDPKLLSDGTLVVLEGRAALDDKDPVQAKLEAAPAKAEEIRHD
jgi:RND family efflux transporter MFP subunit